ncbi:DUF4190 domain-containing protein [Virgisporangium aurantiacum]|uniref:DUF4190 domain-containing protein n=1 Tax=Virgisporangium aurantiacum TaxID=175570 RepID=A0A8J3Z317_9ACTN|nr:DUF4190 domain-containing protein [Virgisporangium aurantiacum]GIJ56384.1 hypothetical protein Vau01_039000 [Virgisporangium aurantiacum]
MAEAIRSSVPPPASVPVPPRPPVPWAPPDSPAPQHRPAQQGPAQQWTAQHRPAQQWPPQPLAPAPPRQPGVNGFAIAALVVGLAGGPVVGAWLASVAIRQIRANGGTGMGMAVTGLVASIAWTLAIVVPITVSLVV